jgi:hypothetical protein
MHSAYSQYVQVLRNPAQTSCQVVELSLDLLYVIVVAEIGPQLFHEIVFTLRQLCS